MFAVQASSITRSSVKTSSMRSVIRDLETREKGVDICIMMDGTGSMVLKILSISHASCIIYYATTCHFYAMHKQRFMNMVLGCSMLIHYSLLLDGCIAL